MYIEGNSLGISKAVLLSLGIQLPKPLFAYAVIKHSSIFAGQKMLLYIIALGMTFESELLENCKTVLIILKTACVNFVQTACFKNTAKRKAKRFQTITHISVFGVNPYCQVGTHLIQAKAQGSNLAAGSLVNNCDPKLKLFNINTGCIAFQRLIIRPVVSFLPCDTPAWYW